MRRLHAVLLVSVLLLSVTAIPIAAAQSRNGGTVVVERGETVNGFSTTASTVIVRGTVDGNLRAQAGSVVIAESGTVTGRVRAFAGSVRIAGTVGDDVVAYTGNVEIERTATLKGSFGAVAGDVDIAGTVRGDAIVGAGTITLAESAHVTEDLNYQGNLKDAGGTVDGKVRRSADLNLLPDVPRLLLAAYLVLVELLFGGLLLLLAPAAVETSVDNLEADPARSLGMGVATVVGAPLIALLLAITAVGIPTALAVLALLVLGVWVGSVVVRYAMGRLVLERLGHDHRWGALVVGVLLAGVLANLPFVGWVVRVAIILVGLGALGLAARGHAEALREVE